MNSSKKLNDLITNGIFPSEIDKLDKYDYANLFDVVKKGEKSYFNLCKNLYFDNVEYINENEITNYMVLSDDSWATISFKFYNTYKLWWLICKFNGINNPFKELEEGTIIKIPSKNLVDSILDVIKSR